MSVKTEYVRHCLCGLAVCVLFLGLYVPAADAAKARRTVRRQAAPRVRTVKEYYRNGKPKLVEHWRGGQREGSFRAYYENGKLRQEGNYEEGQLEGLLVDHAPDGSISAETVYTAGSECGPAEYDASGVLIMPDARAPHGAMSVYYRGGKLKAERHFSYGVGDGRWKNYDRSGMLVSDEEYADSRRNGLRRVYTSSGTISVEETYYNGRRNGPARELYPDGRLAARMSYVNDRLEGTLRRYSPAGNLVREENYRRGDIDGTCRVWRDTPERSLEREESFAGGLRASPVILYDANGVVLEKTQYDGDMKNGYELQYGTAGNIVKEFRYVNGHLNAERSWNE